MTELAEAPQQLIPFRRIKAQDDVLRQISILNILELNDYRQLQIDGRYYIHIPRRSRSDKISESLCELISYDYLERRGRTINKIYYNKVSDFVQLALSQGREWRLAKWRELMGLLEE